MLSREALGSWDFFFSTYSQFPLQFSDVFWTKWSIKEISNCLSNNHQLQAPLRLKNVDGWRLTTTKTISLALKKKKSCDLFIDVIITVAAMQRDTLRERNQKRTNKCIYKKKNGGKRPKTQADGDNEINNTRLCCADDCKPVCSVIRPSPFLPCSSLPCSHSNHSSLIARIPLFYLSLNTRHTHTAASAHTHTHVLPGTDTHPPGDINKCHLIKSYK